jgi:hypothetical protein
MGVYTVDVPCADCDSERVLVFRGRAQGAREVGQVLLVVERAGWSGKFCFCMMSVVIYAVSGVSLRGVGGAGGGTGIFGAGRAVKE